MKIHFLFLFIVFPVLCSFSLIDEEIYYNGDKTEVAGKKKYIYDGKNDIVTINILDTNSVVQTKIVYSYENGKLTECEEYNGRIRAKYSKYRYENGLLATKNDYDVSDRVILVHEYHYNEKKQVISETESLDTGEKFGETVFSYDGYLLTGETLFDQNKKAISSKKYSYDGDKISLVEFFSATGKRVRVIERKYSDVPGKENAFGFRENFVDIR
jgi:hypothetical protein